MKNTFLVREDNASREFTILRAAWVSAWQVHSLLARHSENFSSPLPPPPLTSHENDRGSMISDHSLCAQSHFQWLLTHSKDNAQFICKSHFAKVSLEIICVWERGCRFWQISELKAQRCQRKRELYVGLWNYKRILLRYKGSKKELNFRVRKTLKRECLDSSENFRIWEGQEGLQKLSTRESKWWMAFWSSTFGESNY